jgi:hypothetical protein
MRNDAPKTRHWRLRVRDAEQNVVSEMTFAAVEADSDEGLRRMAGAFAALNATIQETEHLVRQMDSMLSRAERKPYFAAVRGRCVID